MKYIVLLGRDDSYDDYVNSDYFVRPNVCVKNTWNGPYIYYNELIIVVK